MHCFVFVLREEGRRRHPALIAEQGALYGRLVFGRRIHCGPPDVHAALLDVTDESRSLADLKYAQVRKIDGVMWLAGFEPRVPSDPQLRQSWYCAQSLEAGLAVVRRLEVPNRYRIYA